MAKVRLYGATSGYVDLKAPDVADDVTITLPNTTGPFATETYVDSEIAAIPAIAGIGSNVVQTVKTDTFSTTSTSMVPVTGVTATITPSSATSKVQVTLTGIVANNNSGAGVFMNLMRGATAIAQSTGSSGSDQTIGAYTASGNSGDVFAVTFVDSPATTSATTYSLEMRVAAGTGYIGRFAVSDAHRSITTLTLVEVAA